MTDFIRLHEQLNRIEHKLNRLLEGEQQIMTTQDDINAATAQLGVDNQLLKDSAARIEAEIATLEGQGVDTSGLRAAVADLDTAVGDVGAIVPAPVTAPFDGQNVDAATGFTWRITDETYEQSKERLFTFNADAGTAGTAQVAVPYPTEDEWNALTPA